MKQDNGNHAATAVHERAVVELAHRELTDQRNRLRAVNAELVEALERIAFRPNFEAYETFGEFAQRIACAALKNAKEG